MCGHTLIVMDERVKCGSLGEPAAACVWVLGIGVMLGGLGLEEANLEGNFSEFFGCHWND